MGKLVAAVDFTTFGYETTYGKNDKSDITATDFMGDGKQLSLLLDEDPATMERRQQCAKRLELYKSARDEIDSVAWAR
ncbi:hypothetical protein GIB67_015448 [Kingdonia uniflora]|uniref:GED domain-containing protein n=1 Tax=Kingdonia uniflora TaxID=39325 RepID=A0A7J7KYZ2_9MAGN|nr:hypothetical protein GIB67_015448 [Kingdonia uniflora]